MGQGLRPDRHQDGSAEDEVPRDAEGREGVQADDAHRVVDRRLSGRRQLRAAPLQQEHHQNNNACAVIPEYDKLYEQSIRMPASPERDKLYHEMAKIIETLAPWRLDISRYRNMLAQPQVLGYKKHPILHSEWQYIDVDTGKKSK